MASQDRKSLIPELAQDLIAGTIGGWAQVAIGMNELHVKTTNTRN